MVKTIDNIKKKSSFIYYRKEFSATAHYQFLGSVKKGKIEFVVEVTPTGSNEIQIKLIDPVDYPILSVLRDLKKSVNRLVEEDKLPE
nr:hypothetical protein [Treponema phagedenis]